MSTPSNTQLVLRPLLCFGLVLMSGIVGFAYAALTDWIFFVEFLLVFLPCSFVVCSVGAVFAYKAYSGLPTGSYTRWQYILTATIILTVVGLFVCAVVFANATSHGAGGF